MNNQPSSPKKPGIIESYARKKLLQHAKPEAESDITKLSDRSDKNVSDQLALLEQLKDAGNKLGGSMAENHAIYTTLIGLDLSDIPDDETPRDSNNPTNTETRDSNKEEKNVIDTQFVTFRNLNKEIMNRPIPKHMLLHILYQIEAFEKQTESEFNELGHRFRLPLILPLYQLEVACGLGVIPVFGKLKNTPTITLKELSELLKAYSTRFLKSYNIPLDNPDYIRRITNPLDLSIELINEAYRAISSVNSSNDLLNSVSPEPVDSHTLGEDGVTSEGPSFVGDSTRVDIQTLSGKAALERARAEARQARIGLGVAVATNVIPFPGISGFVAGTVINAVSAGVVNYNHPTGESEFDNEVKLDRASRIGREQARICTELYILLKKTPEDGDTLVSDLDMSYLRNLMFEVISTTMEPNTRIRLNDLIGKFVTNTPLITVDNNTRLVQLLNEFLNVENNVDSQPKGTKKWGEILNATVRDTLHWSVTTIGLTATAISTCVGLVVNSSDKSSIKSKRENYGKHIQETSSSQSTETGTPMIAIPLHARNNWKGFKQLREGASTMGDNIEQKTAAKTQIAHSIIELVSLSLRGQLLYDGDVIVDDVGGAINRDDILSSDQGIACVEMVEKELKKALPNSHNVTAVEIVTHAIEHFVEMQSNQAPLSQFVAELSHNLNRGANLHEIRKLSKLALPDTIFNLDTHAASENEDYLPDNVQTFRQFKQFITTDQLISEWQNSLPSRAKDGIMDNLYLDEELSSKTFAMYELASRIHGTSLFLQSPQDEQTYDKKVFSGLESISQLQTDPSDSRLLPHQIKNPKFNLRHLNAIIREAAKTQPDITKLLIRMFDDTGRYRLLSSYENYDEILAAYKSLHDAETFLLQQAKDRHERELEAQRKQEEEAEAERKKVEEKQQEEDKLAEINRKAAKEFESLFSPSVGVELPIENGPADNPTDDAESFANPPSEACPEPSSANPEEVKDSGDDIIDAVFHEIPEDTGVPEQPTGTKLLPPAAVASVVEDTIPQVAESADVEQSLATTIRNFGENYPDVNSFIDKSGYEELLTKIFQNYGEFETVLSKLDYTEIKDNFDIVYIFRDLSQFADPESLIELFEDTDTQATLYDFLKLLSTKILQD